MLDSRKSGRFIAEKRKSLGMTQQQLADRISVSFQSISKYENGSAYPSIEILYDLAMCLQVTVDEILTGVEREQDSLSYSKAGVDISYTDAIKQEMAKYLKTENPRVMNGLGAFASLYDIDFPKLEHPLLVLKSEEPGSKQKLAMEYGYTESICHDMINHLVNDIVVMGAVPLAVLDTIICGKAEKQIMKSLVKGISEACQENDCVLVGGETSIQPMVVDAGTYVLTASIAGIVDQKKVIDGSKIREGDVVLAITSNGLHTNGYSLVRMMMERYPQMKLDRVDGLTFMEQIMKPHTPYYKAIQGLFGQEGLHGMAHITGGGIEGNLCRIIPNGLSARIELSKLRILSIFKYIRQCGNISDAEMMHTFNMGVGFQLVVAPEYKESVIKHISKFYDCYEIGQIVAGEEKVVLEGKLNWL